MAKQKSIAVSPDTFERFDWYRTAFSMTSDDLLKFMMDKLGLATIDEVRQYKLTFRPGPPTEADAALVEANKPEAVPAEG